MTIYHWCPESSLGGVEVAVLTFVQSSLNLRHVVFTGDASGPFADRWRDAGAEVIEVAEWKSGMRKFYVRWRRLMREQRPKYFIAWSPSRLPLLMAPMNRSTKCLVHVGNTTVSPAVTQWRFRLMHALLLVKVVPILVACSSAAAVALGKDAYLRRFSRVVIPNAASAAFFEPFSGPRAIGPVWGMVARLDLIKNQALLVDAAALVIQEVPEFRLILVGEGDTRAALENKIRSLGLSHVVSLPGKSTNVIEMLHGWQGFLFSTTPDEGFGIALAEAMAAGLPCIVSDLPVMREVGGDAVIYAKSAEDFAKALVHLIKKENAREKQGELASLRANAHFSPVKFAASYTGLFGIS